MTGVRVLAEHDLTALVCDESEPGEGWTVAFAHGAEGAEGGADVLWVGSAEGADGARRLIAPAGESLWRRAPWPAADSLFDLGAPPAPHVVAVVGAPEVTTTLVARGLAAEDHERLGVEPLTRAAVIVHGGPPDRPLPAAAPAVLAAGRVLVTTPASPTFGFRGAIDHCVGSTADDLADLAESVVRHWDAFHAMRVHGRVAAERHRASRVLADLAVDLALEG